MDIAETAERMKKAGGFKSNSALANHLKVSKQAVSNWKITGKVPYKECLRIAKETGVSFEYLLTGEDTREVVVYKVAKLLFSLLGSGSYQKFTAHQLANTLQNLYLAETKEPSVVNQYFIEQHISLLKKERFD